MRISGYAEFADDLPRFHGIADTLRSYVPLMPTLQWYGQHYPPGNLLLLEIERATGVTGLTKTLVILATALTVIPLYKLGRELELDERSAGLAALLFSASTSVLILCTINTTSLLVLPATMCLWMLVRGMRTGSALTAAILGTAFWFYLMFSFSASILGVMMALIVILAWREGIYPLRNIIRTGAISLAALGAIIATVYLATRFNLVACFISAIHGHHEQQGNGGFDTPARWLIRSTGNILAYAFSTVPVCILAASAAVALWRARDRSLARALFTALIATIFIAGFSGLFYIETERIWIFMTPALAIAAAVDIGRRQQTGESTLPQAILLIILIVSCAEEFLYMHYR